jgi:hypothetical protein
MSFYKTAQAVGEEVVSRASRLRVKLGDDVIASPVVGKIQIVSELEKGGDRRYFVPKIGRIVKLGDSDEITLDEVRFGKGLRDSFKAGGEWLPEEPPEPPILRQSVEAQPPAWDEPPPHDDADIVDINPDDEIPM